QRMLAGLGIEADHHLDQPDISQFLDDADGGSMKLYLITTALRLRREQPDLFASGSYEPLMIDGKHSANVCAFARHLGGRTAIVIVPRVVAGVWGGEMHPPLGVDTWDDTRLQLPVHLGNSIYRNIFTGESLMPADGALRLSDVANVFPVAMLFASGGSSL